MFITGVCECSHPRGLLFVTWPCMSVLCYTYAKGFRVLDSCISSSLFLFGSGSLLVLLTGHAQQSYFSDGVHLFAIYIVFFSHVFVFLVCWSPRQ